MAAEATPDIDWKLFGEWVAELRDALGLSRSEVAARAGLSASNLASLEGGGRVQRGQWVYPSPNNRTLIRLADALDVDRDDLFKRLGRRPPRLATRTTEPGGLDLDVRVGRLEARMDRQEQGLAEIRDRLDGVAGRGSE